MKAGKAEQYRVRRTHYFTYRKVKQSSQRFNTREEAYAHIDEMKKKHDQFEWDYSIEIA